MNSVEELFSGKFDYDRINTHVLIDEGTYHQRDGQWVCDRDRFIEFVMECVEKKIAIDHPRYLNGEPTTFLATLYECDYGVRPVDMDEVEIDDPRFEYGTCPWWSFGYVADDHEWIFAQPDDC